MVAVAKEIKFDRVSASQIMVFDPAEQGGCERKWWFEKTVGRPPPTKAQYAGTKLHAQIEHYLKTGEDVLGPLARAGKHFLPAPREWLLVEYPFMLRVAGVPLKGVIDALNQSGYWIDNEGKKNYEDIPELLDWKTTKSLVYAKTPAQIATNTQLNIYAKHVADREGVSEVRLSHGNFVTGGVPSAEKRSVKITLDTLNQKWHLISQTVERMKLVALADKPEDVAPNYKSCRAYGRDCPFLAQCPRVAGDLVKSIFGEVKENMSLLNKFRGETVEIRGAAVQEIVPDAPAGSSYMTSARAAGILPPDAPASDPAKASEIANAPPLEVYADEPPKTVGKKRGRPRKTTEDTTAYVSAPIEERGAWEDQQEDFPPIEERMPTVGITLFVDCYIEGLIIPSLEPYVTDMLRAIEKAFKVADVRAAGKDSPLAYGGWKGVLAAGVREKPPQPGAYSLSDVRESEIRQVVVDALRPMLSLYVRMR